MNRTLIIFDGTDTMECNAFTPSRDGENVLFCYPTDGAATEAGIQVQFENKKALDAAIRKIHDAYRSGEVIVELLPAKKG